MFGHIERFFSTYWALFSSVWGYLGPIWGYAGPIWGYVGPMWAYLRLMLGLCWAYLDPFLAYIGPDQEFWPLLENMQKHRILEQKCPPKLKLISYNAISYNAIANGSPRHTQNASAPSVRADFNPLVFWYQREYLLTSKEFIFLQGI